LDGGEQLGDEAGLDVGEFVDLRVAVLDDERGPGKGGELGEGVGERSLHEGGAEIGQALALDHGDDLAVERNAVVAGGQPATLGGRLEPGEAVGVALAGVDEHRQGGEGQRPSGWHAYSGSGFTGGGRALPEDPLTAALDGREHELGAVEPGPVEDQVDGHAPTPARAHGDFLHDVGTLGPGVGPVAVDLGGARPAVAGLEDEGTVGEREADQDGSVESASGLRATTNVGADRLARVPS
jgi:hypothetical protein